MSKKNATPLLKFRYVALVIIGSISLVWAMLFFRNLLVSKNMPATSKGIPLVSNDLSEIHRSEIPIDVEPLPEPEQEELVSAPDSLPNLDETGLAEADRIEELISDLMTKRDSPEAPEKNTPELPNKKKKVPRKLHTSVKKLEALAPTKLSRKSPVVKPKPSKSDKPKVSNATATATATESISVPLSGSDIEFVGSIPYETIVRISHKTGPDFDHLFFQEAEAAGFPGIIQIAPNGSNALTLIQDAGNNQATLFQETPNSDNQASISQTRLAINE